MHREQSFVKPGPSIFRRSLLTRRLLSLTFLTRLAALQHPVRARSAQVKPRAPAEPEQVEPALEAAVPAGRAGAARAEAAKPAAGPAVSRRATTRAISPWAAQARTLYIYFPSLPRGSPI